MQGYLLIHFLVISTVGKKGVAGERLLASVSGEYSKILNVVEISRKIFEVVGS
jgi:Trk-type K+ transport system membrane component